MVLSKANEAYRVLYNPARSDGILATDRVLQVISRARDQVRQENLDHLLNQLMKHAVERKLTNDCVFNMDETRFGQ
uniref:AlNc14C396G11325 protein n=1 Tax=Albugo laibachii Nc14 TaxID=890382 RepID=F0WYR4_9STRA|nr:AlNc14C396G11325 [Albugo laibachii Nc14]|eukprot:CCA26623.1 AlNc14C396G11325 [Albugo laibachii Nc14]